MSACINIKSLFTGFESILEGLFGPGVVKDITLFQGKREQISIHKYKFILIKNTLGQIASHNFMFNNLSFTNQNRITADKTVMTRNCTRERNKTNKSVKRCECLSVFIVYTYL